MCSYRSAEAVGTGIDLLDRALPGGGLPRGRLVVWSPGGGATAVLRSACMAVVSRGERAAWVDGAGLMAGEFWEEGGQEGECADHGSVFWRFKDAERPERGSHAERSALPTSTAIWSAEF